MKDRSMQEIEEMQGAKYINPYTDFGFKKLFGTPLNKDLLISFLNSLFKGREVVRDLTYLNGENLGNGYGDRRAIFDVYCENEQGETFIVEMQKAERQDYEDSLKVYRDMKNVLDTAELKGMKKGMKKGMEKGLEKGRKEGLKKGIEQGSFEERRKNARAMKDLGLPLETIAKVTGMTAEDIEKV